MRSIRFALRFAAASAARVASTIWEASKKISKIAAAFAATCIVGAFLQDLLALGLDKSGSSKDWSIAPIRLVALEPSILNKEALRSAFEAYQPTGAMDIEFMAAKKHWANAQDATGATGQWLFPEDFKNSLSRMAHSSKDRTKPGKKEAEAALAKLGEALAGAKSAEDAQEASKAVWLALQKNNKERAEKQEASSAAMFNASVLAFTPFESEAFPATRRMVGLAGSANSTHWRSFAEMGLLSLMSSIAAALAAAILFGTAKCSIWIAKSIWKGAFSARFNSELEWGRSKLQALLRMQHKEDIEEAAGPKAKAKNGDGPKRL